QVEESLASITAEKDRLALLLSNPDTYADKAKFIETEKAFQQASETHAQLNQEYEQLFEKLMQHEA
ncbi:MAG: hypothetical protein ACO3BD_07035, partial [Chitinophagaceae bacterium]